MAFPFVAAFAGLDLRQTKRAVWDFVLFLGVWTCNGSTHPHRYDEGSIP